MLTARPRPGANAVVVDDVAAQVGEGRAIGSGDTDVVPPVEEPAGGRDRDLEPERPVRMHDQPDREPGGIRSPPLRRAALRSRCSPLPAARARSLRSRSLRGPGDGLGNHVVERATADSGVSPRPEQELHVALGSPQW